MIMPDHIRRSLPALVIALSTFFSLIYSSGPIFEAPDERQHYFYLRYLATVKELPDVYFLPDRTLGSEMFEPPLYYAVGALIAQRIDDSDFMEIHERKNIYHPNLARLYASDPKPPMGNDNKNFLLHSRREDFPYTQSGTALAVHVARLFSVTLGAATLILCLAIFRLLWPNNPNRQLLALSVAAFWPLRLFIAGSINNDNLIALMSTASVCLALRLLTMGPTWRDAILLGASLGGAALAKENAFLLAAPLGVVLLFDFKRQRRFLAAAIFVALIMSGWWYARNWIYYENATSFRNQPSYISDTERGIDAGMFKLEKFPDRMLLVYQRFWASFNHDGTVPVSDELNTLYDSLTLAGLMGAVIGLASWIRRSRAQPLDRNRWTQLLALSSYVLALIAGVGYIVMINVFAAQPRFLIPGVAAISGLLAFGWDSLTPTRFKFRVSLSVAMLMAAMSCVALAGYFLPAYRPLPAPDRIAHRLNLNYENAVVLLGVAEETVTAYPGEKVAMTLYWAAVKPADDMNFIMWPRGRDASLFGALSYPGNGHLLANEWEPGQRWAERYVFELPETVPPGSYALTVSYEQNDTLQILWATAPDGTRDQSPIIMTLIVPER